MPTHWHTRLFIELYSWKQVKFPSTSCYAVVQSGLTLCDPTDHSLPGFPVLSYPLEFAQTHVHRVSDATHQSQNVFA